VDGAVAILKSLRLGPVGNKHNRFPDRHRSNASMQLRWDRKRHVQPSAAEPGGRLHWRCWACEKRWKATKALVFEFCPFCRQKTALEVR
jgi:hypothetical protein